LDELMDADVSYPDQELGEYVFVVVSMTPVATLIQVSGELDLGSAHHLEDCLSRAVSDGDGKPIHLDLAEVTFVDCAGLAPLIRAAAELRDGRVLKVVSASRRVRRLVELIGDVGFPIEAGSPDVISVT
jgi:anti-anti-sigma factor